MWARGSCSLCLVMGCPDLSLLPLFSSPPLCSCRLASAEGPVRSHIQVPTEKGCDCFRELLSFLPGRDLAPVHLLRRRSSYKLAALGPSTCPVSRSGGKARLLPQKACGHAMLLSESTEAALTPGRLGGGFQGGSFQSPLRSRSLEHITSPVLRRLAYLACLF